MSTYAALAEPNRREILDLLRGGERSVGDLVDRLTLSQPGVSKHLKVLREAGLVAVRSQGKQRLYALRSAAAGRGRRVAGALPRVLVGALRRARTTPGGEPMIDGTLETIDGRPALRFERRLAHPRRARLARGHRARRARAVVRRAGRLDARARRDLRGRGPGGRDHRARGARAAALDLGRRALRVRAGARRRRLPARLHPRLRRPLRPGRAARRRLGDLPRPPRRACSPAARCPRRTRTARSASCTSATRPASGRTRRRGGA